MAHDDYMFLKVVGGIACAAAGVYIAVQIGGALGIGQHDKNKPKAPVTISYEEKNKPPHERVGHKPDQAPKTKTKSKPIEEERPTIDVNVEQAFMQYVTLREITPNSTTATIYNVEDRKIIYASSQNNELAGGFNVSLVYTTEAGDKKVFLNPDNIFVKKGVAKIEFNKFDLANNLDSMVRFSTKGTHHVESDNAETVINGIVTKVNYDF